MSSKVRDQRVKCTIPGCSRILSGYKGLHAHLHAHENEKKHLLREMKPLKDRLYKCSQCQRSFRKKYNLLCHLTKRHDTHQQQSVIEIYV
jgi:recombinational DNA repair protein RecR